MSQASSYGSKRPYYDGVRTQALMLSCDLLHQLRRADPRAGTWEAADLQWWWRVARETDDLQQTFVVDGRRPLATVRLTAWSEHWGLDVMRAPGVGAAWREVAEQAWHIAQQHGAGAVESLVTPDDGELIEWLEDHGLFWHDAASGVGLVEPVRVEDPASTLYRWDRSG